jgi:hypothetical protein
MRSRSYPPGTVRDLLETDLVTPPTREVLRPRLGKNDSAEPHFFDTGAFTILQAVCARLIPQPERADPIDLARTIDERLAGGKSDGWRYATMPPDGEAHRHGLAGLDESAQAMFGGGFASLGKSRQDAVLQAVQHGEVKGGVWDTLPAQRFFEELLAEAVECYYSHPLAQEEIGYVGMADAHGWQAIGLDRLEPWEPQAVDDTHE